MKTKGKGVAFLTGTIALLIGIFALYFGWSDLRFWYLFEPLGLNAQGYLEYRHRQTEIVFVRLPGGTFWMGAQKTDPNGRNYDPEALEDEEPVHEVTLSPFMIGKYEVTQRQWKDIMGWNRSKFANNENNPVEQISWEDIQKFIAKTGLSIPTEAQWEYCCNSLNNRGVALNDSAWFGQNSFKSTHPVGKKAENVYGLHDIHGNVWEYCADAYQSYFYSDQESKKDNPLCKEGNKQTRRGGSWFESNINRFRPSLREWCSQDNRGSVWGFRISFDLRSI